MPVSPDRIRNQFDKWGVEPEPLFPPDIRKLNTLIAQARAVKRKVVDAERYDLATPMWTRERAAMRRRAELLTDRHDEPNRIPLSAGSVQRIVDRLEPYEFDRLSSLLGGKVLGDAKGAVRRSAERHIAWVSGANDHLARAGAMIRR